MIKRMLKELNNILFIKQYELAELIVLLVKITFGALLMLYSPNESNSPLMQNINHVLDARIVGFIFMAVGVFHLISLLNQSRKRRMLAASFAIFLWLFLFLVALQTKGGLVWVVFFVFGSLQALIIVRLWRERYREYI